MDEQDLQLQDVNRLSRPWTTRDIAWFFQVSDNKARQIADTPGFPEPSRLPGGRLVRWDPHQVIAWWNGQGDAETAQEPEPEPEPEPPTFTPHRRPVGRPPKDRS